MVQPARPRMVLNQFMSHAPETVVPGTAGVQIWLAAGVVLPHLTVMAEIELVQTEGLPAMDRMSAEPEMSAS
jgi:hypothetical protein